MSDQDQASDVEPDAHSTAMSRIQACLNAGIDPQLASRLKGDTPEALATDAQLFADAAAKPQRYGGIGVGLTSHERLPAPPDAASTLFGALTRSHR